MIVVGGRRAVAFSLRALGAGRTICDVDVVVIPVGVGRRSLGLCFLLALACHVLYILITYYNRMSVAGTGFPVNWDPIDEVHVVAHIYV